MKDHGEPVETEGQVYRPPDAYSRTARGNAWTRRAKPRCTFEHERDEALHRPSLAIPTQTFLARLSLRVPSDKVMSGTRPGRGASLASKVTDLSGA